MQVILQKVNCFPSLLKRIQKQFLLLLILSVGIATNSFAQPANDEPCNAIPLTADVVCTYQTFTNLNATETVGPPAPGCANFQGADVWFQVVVPAASNGVLKFDTQAGGITDCGMAIYRGDCTNLQLIECDDDDGAGFMSQITLNSLTVGSTLWIRIWSYGNNGNGTFGICIKYPGPPPAYDEPCTATALPDPTTTCNYQTFSNESATATPNVTDPGCANYQGNDVWFTVTVPAGGLLKFDTQTGEMTDGGMAIYSGTCSSLTLIACDDDASPNGLMPQIIAANLTPASTIWIRVWGKGNVAANNGSFGICVTIPPPPPPNDDPCNAILLTANSTCTYQTYSTQSSGSTSGVPAPGCANYQGGDVWFKIVVPCDGKIVLDTDDGVITDGGMAAYRGTCDNLQLIECDDDDSPNGLMSYLNLSSLTPGSTIFIRVWEYGNDNPGTFGICASIPPPPPPGGNCLGAQSFCSSNTYTYANSTNVPSLGGGGIYGCLGSTPNPAWYYFQVATPGDISIFIQQTAQPSGTIVDVDFALWGPFPNLPASCGNLAATNIVSCSYSTSGTETAVLTNAQAGDVYVLLITNFSNQAGTVTFNQSAGAGSTNCNIVCTLTAANSGPACACGTVNLTASTVVGATYQWTGPNCFDQTPGSNQQNPTNVPVPCAPGTYIYTVTATTPPPTGSTCFAQTTVIVTAAPTVGADTTVYVCPGGTKDLTTVYSTLTGLTPDWTSYPAGTPVADPTAADAGVYQVIGTNASGCKDTALVTVTLDQVTFDVTATGIASCTLPGEITVTNAVGVGNAFEYNIETYPGVFQPSNIFVADAGPHVITVRDSIGCEASMPVTVDFTNDLTLDATPASTTICSGQSANLTATTNNSGSSYAWLPTTGLNDASSATPIASPTTSTVYTVTATVGPCTQTATIDVVVDSDLAVDAGGPLTINAGSSQQATATVTGTNTNLSSILWTPAAGLSATNVLNPIVTPVITTGSATYQVTVTNTSGCTATDDLVVNIVNDLTCRNLRNAFTPNGDGNNDLWMVYDDFSCLTNVEVNVFNRYGNKVFESQKYRNDWNGTYKGKAVPDGTYYAIVTYTMAATKKVITVKTDLTILR